MSFFHSLLYSQGEAAPTVQATNLVFSNVLSTSLTLSWTNGDGDGRVVVAKAGAVDSNPVNGTDYTANAAFGSGDQIGTGNYVVYGGTGSTVNITGLTAGTEYYFRVYEYNGETTGIVYFNDTATGNPASVTPAFSFWAAFQDDDATPVANPYTTYSSHLMDVTQTTNELSISSGSLVKTGTGAVGSNKLKSQDAVARARGLCIAFRFKYTTTNQTVVQLGYDQPGASGFAHGFSVSTNALAPVDRFSVASTGITLSASTWYHAFVILRDNGAYWIINIDTGYYLFYVSSRWNFASVHQYVSSGYVSEVDYAREKQLAGDFTSSEWGLATASITSAVNGSTFTHGASGWIVFYLQTKATAGTIELRFRIQDATNYLKLTIDSTNVGKLFSTVAGVDTQLGSNATISQGAEYRIFLNATSVRIFGDGSTALLISGTDSNFSGQSSGELTSQGTGGDITYIHCLPYEITDNGQIAELEGITSISEPP